MFHAGIDLDKTGRFERAFYLLRDGTQYEPLRLRQAAA